MKHQQVVVKVGFCRAGGRAAGRRQGSLLPSCRWESWRNAGRKCKVSDGALQDLGQTRKENEENGRGTTSVCLLSSQVCFRVSASVVIYYVETHTEVALNVPELILNYTNQDAVYTPLQINHSIQLTCIHNCLYIASASCHYNPVQVSYKSQWNCGLKLQAYK